MSNARNLSKFKPSSSGLVETADIADDAVTTAKVDPAQTDITSVGTLTGLSVSGDVGIGGAADSDARLLLRDNHTTAVTDGATLLDNTTFAINGNESSGSDNLRIGPVQASGAYFIEVTNSGGSAGYNLALNPINAGNVGIGVLQPSHQLHIESHGSNTYATMKLEGQNRGGQIDMFQNTLITNQILGDQSGNLYIGSSGGFGQSALDSQVEFSSNNKCPAIKSATFLTQFADDASRNVASNLQGLVIITSYNLGLTFIGRHEYQNAVQIISANGNWSNSDTDGKICVISGTNDYSITLKNRYGSALDFKVLMVGTVQ